MKKLLSSFLALFFVLATVQAQSFFSDTDAFLKKHVDNYGMVDYPGIKASPGQLNKLVDQIKGYSVKGKTAAEAKAFYINAYNILMIKSVVDHYPISKPLDVPGMFDKIKHNVAGTSLTLSDIENKVLRVKYPDARLHFVLVCGAKSCPPLANYAFTPSNLESSLTARTKKAMNNKQFIRVDDANKKVAISKIFEWYKADFDKEAKSFIDFINKYKSTPIPTSYKVTTYEYNWALNLKKK